MTEPGEDRAYRKRWLSWALYDVANSAFYLTIVAAVFPFYYIGAYVDAHRPAGGDEATLKILASSSLGFTAGIAMIIVAILGPILGTIADRRSCKKILLAAFALVGVLASGLLYVAGDNILFLQILYAVGTVGVAGSIVFYDAMLPSVAREKDLDRISTIGFSLGYAGSVLLFILNSVVIMKHDSFGLSKGEAARLSFLSVAVWWAVFTIPLLRWVPEPAARPAEGGANLLLDGFRQLGRTFRKLRTYRQLLFFLLAYWIYVDGVGTIIKLATPFGKSMGLDDADLLLALIVTQFVGVPCALGFGWLGGHIGAKNGILIGLGVYALICVGAAFMTVGVAWQFYAMAVGVGVVQGGVQGLSRSLFASMIPSEQSGEFFGFFSTMSKFAGILGPFVLGLFWSTGDDPRRGILAMAAFFIVGGILLWRVNVEEGRKAVLKEIDG